MKRNLLRVFLTSLLVMSALLAGCKDDKVDEVIDPELSVDPSELTFTADGSAVSSDSFAVKSNQSWNITFDEKEDWFELSSTSGTGDQTIKVTVNVNPDEETRRVDLSVKTNTLEKKVTIIQRGGEAYQTQELYNIKFGVDAPAGGTYPYLDEWIADGKDLQESGEGSSTVELAGNGVSLRTSGMASENYPDASGGNNLFFGTNGPTFLINKISTNGGTDFMINFGISRYTNGDNSFSIDLMNVYYSTDGNNYNVIGYDYTSQYTDYWNYATGTFRIDGSAEFIYIKFAANEASTMRIDDVTVTSRKLVLTEPKVFSHGADEVGVDYAVLTGSFQIPEDVQISRIGVRYAPEDSDEYTEKDADKIETPFSVRVDELEQSTVYKYRSYLYVGEEGYYGEESTFTTDKGIPTEALYYEYVGETASQVDGQWPWTGDFTGWNRGGILDQSAVTYSGGNTSVRVASRYDDPMVSGGPFVFFGANPAYFEINNINIDGNENLTFSFGISYESSFVGNQSVFEEPIHEGTVTLEASLDGIAWLKLPFENDPNPAKWVIVTSEFKVLPGSDKLFIRLSKTIAASKIRFDDFTLMAGGNGADVVGAHPRNLVTTPTAKYNERYAYMDGFYNLQQGDQKATEIGFEYKASSSSSWSKEIMDSPISYFEGMIGGLEGGTTYDYRSYVISGGTTFHGETRTFTTSAVGGGFNAIYFEDMGIDVSGTPLPQDFQDWTRGGTMDQSAVKYSGYNSSIRYAGSSYSSGLVSGDPYLFLGANPTFMIEEINISGKDNFTFRFGISYQSSYGSGPVFASPVDNNTLKLEASIDGKLWNKLTFTPNGTNPAPWVIVTTEFKTPSTADKLYIRVSEPIVSSGIRLADFALIEGGSGTVTIGEGAQSDLKFGTPSVTPALRIGQTITDGKVIIPYSGAVGNEAYNVTVSISGPASTGIAVTNPGGVVLNEGSGEIVATITGNPSASGTVTFTVDGIDLLPAPSNQVTVMVNEGDKSFVTVSQLRGLSTPITDDLYVKVVALSVDNKSSLKALTVSDETAGITIFAAANLTGSYPQGTEIEISLKNGTLSEYNGLLQLGIAESAMSVLGTAAMPYKEITAAELLTGAYESMYVGVKDVQVVSADLDKNVGDKDGNTSINIISRTGEEFVMYSTKYITFLDKKVPQGSGILKGTASIYKGQFQIMPHSESDLAGMTGARF